MSHRGGRVFWPQFQLTDRVADLNQLLRELSQAAAFGNLPSRLLEGRDGNGSLAGGTPDLPLKEPQGTMPGIALSSAPTVCLPALAKTGKQPPRAQVSDSGEFPTDRVAPIVEGSEIVGGHG